MNPMTGNPGRCARAAIGNRAADPAMALMKSRRRMPSPGMQDRSNSRMEIETSDEHRGPRQNDPDLGEFSGLCLDLDDAGVLLDDDVVADREAETGALPAWLGGEERIEHLVFHLGRDAGAVVADPDFHTITEVF